MEYTTIYAPMLIIFLSLLSGMLIGCAFTFFMLIKDMRGIELELDKLENYRTNERQ